MSLFQHNCDFSWIRCNRCFIAIPHLTNIVLTSCGHFLCNSCSRGIPGYQFNCPVCNALVTKISINSERDIPADLLHYFEPLPSVVKKITDSAQQLIEISTWRQTQLEEYAKHLEAELAVEREKNRKLEAASSEQQTLRKQVSLVSNENSKLRLNLSSNVSALQFSSKPPSSLIGEFMHNKSPASTDDRPKPIISKESMQQLFSQRPNTSSIMPATPMPATPLSSVIKRPPPSTPDLFNDHKRRRLDSTTPFSVPSTPPKSSMLTPSPARSTDMFNKIRSAEKENREINFVTPQKSGNDTPTNNRSTAERFAELRSQNEQATKIRTARDGDTADRFAKLRNMLSTKSSPTNSNANE